MATHGATPLSCFFISPIGDDDSAERKNSDLVKDHILIPALVPQLVATVTRADGDANPGEVTPAIVRAILDAKLVVADLTGANPNVYYELAIAHAFRKPTIHIAKPGELPRFDIKDSRVVRYGTMVDEASLARDAIFRAAEYALENPESAETPVSRTADLVSLKESGDPAARQIEYLAQQIAQLDATVGHALRSSSDQSRRREAHALNRLDPDLLGWVNELWRFALSMEERKIQSKSSKADHVRLRSIIERLERLEHYLVHEDVSPTELAFFRKEITSAHMELAETFPGVEVPTRR